MHLLMAILILCCPPLLIAADQQNVSGSAVAGCKSSPESRQFDFWIGEWNVIANGKPAGTSSIQLILDDCVIFENWSGVSGYKGKSFNMYNAAINKWQQFWVDNSGESLIFTGNFKSDRMTFTGETPQPGGKIRLERLTFFKLSENKVRQLWEQSTDQGKTWSTVFDGLYTRK
jgi:hypothetical protein